MATTLSVDGQDGATLASSSGIRLVQDESQALVLRNRDQATRDGRPGASARQAICGGPAGTLIVQLSESNLTQGGIRVQCRDNSSTHNLPEITEVPIGRDLRLTAIGGKGEEGMKGGDGQSGMKGEDGTDASEADDATNGMNGGRGGDAGRGSSGGDGGPGGEIHIVLNEDSTHLLMAVSCDVSGGKGGIAGQHGLAGEGGRGGTGGQGWRWDKIIGYKPFCTDSCFKNTESSATSSIVTRTSSHLAATTNALRAQSHSLVVRGNNVQAVIAQAAIRYNAMRHSTTDTGYCKCGGGTGTCQGCDVKPIWAKLTRAPGLDGQGGARGRDINTILTAGKQGHRGSFTIAVRLRDGSTATYSSPWSLKLDGFEVEDENGDGIFEPGEHVFICRIKIRNVGGMPSPTCRIPITLADSSEWFEPVPADEGGQTFLPTSIPAGGSASTEGTIKVRIKRRDQCDRRLPALGARFSAKDTLKIRADMPWLERRMPSFELGKEIEISHPCRLQDFQYLTSVAQGAVSMVKYKVLNMSNYQIGGCGDSGTVRTVQVRTIITKELARISAEDETEHQELTAPISYVPPKDSVGMHQQFRVLSNAKIYKHCHIHFELWLESPLQDPDSNELEEVLVERHAIRFQISNTYSRTDNADILLITNPKTTETQSLAMQNFIRKDLRMQLDICNVHQNGGLLLPQQDDTDEPLSLLSAYRNKMILVLDDSFKFLNAESRTASELCDPQWLSELAMSGASTLFFGSGSTPSIGTILRSSVILPLTKVEAAVDQTKGTHIFHSKEELANAIIQEKQFGSVKRDASTISLPPVKWYRFGRDKASRQAKKLAAYLQKRFPNERFLVTHVASKHPMPSHFGPAVSDNVTRAGAGSEFLVVLPCLNHHVSMMSTESSIAASPNSNDLDRLGRYLIVAALPFGQRIAMLWENPYLDPVILKAIILSVMRDLSAQIARFFSTSQGHTSSIKDRSTSPEHMYEFLLIHLPYVHCILFSAPNDRQLILPVPLRDIISWTLTFTTLDKRYRNINTLLRSIIHSPTVPTWLRSIELQDNTASPSSTSTTNPSSTPYRIEDIIQSIAQLTSTPEFMFTKGQTSTSDVVPETRYCTPQEWDRMVRSVEEWRERLRRDGEDARKVLGRMLVERHREGLGDMAGL